MFCETLKLIVLMYQRRTTDIVESKTLDFRQCVNVRWAEMIVFTILILFYSTIMQPKRILFRLMIEVQKPPKINSIKFLVQMKNMDISRYKAHDAYDSTQANFVEITATYKFQARLGVRNESVFLLFWLNKISCRKLIYFQDLRFSIIRTKIMKKHSRVHAKIVHVSITHTEES